ncbi:hypothetical protein [Trinickia sp. YCB016]
MRPISTLAITFTLALAAGCTTVGHPYPFPQDGEPSAELQIQGRSVYLLTFNQKGCYTGKTHVDGGPGAMPVKVVPDKPLVISYEENVCMMPSTFTPQKDGHYRLIALEGPKAPDKDLNFFQLIGRQEERQCVVAVTELDSEGQPAQPVKVKVVRAHQVSFACIKFR